MYKESLKLNGVKAIIMLYLQYAYVKCVTNINFVTCVGKYNTNHIYILCKYE